MSVLASEKEGLDHELQTSGQPIILPIVCRSGENGQPNPFPHLPPSLSLHSQVLMSILIHRDPGKAESEGLGRTWGSAFQTSLQEPKLLDDSLNGKVSTDWETSRNNLDGPTHYTSINDKVMNVQMMSLCLFSQMVEWHLYTDDSVPSQKSTLHFFFSGSEYWGPNSRLRMYYTSALL